MRWRSVGKNEANSDGLKIVKITLLTLSGFLGYKFPQCEIISEAQIFLIWAFLLPEFWRVEMFIRKIAIASCLAMAFSPAFAAVSVAHVSVAHVSSAAPHVSTPVAYVAPVHVEPALPVVRSASVPVAHPYVYHSTGNCSNHDKVCEH